MTTFEAFQFIETVIDEADARLMRGENTHLVVEAFDTEFSWLLWHIPTDAQDHCRTFVAYRWVFLHKGT